MYTLWPIQTKKDRGRRIFLQEYDQGILDPCQSVEIKFHGGRRNSYFRVGYSPARPTIFLEKKRGEGGEGGEGAAYVNPVRRCNDGRSKGNAYTPSAV